MTMPMPMPVPFPATRTIHRTPPGPPRALAVVIVSPGRFNFEHADMCTRSPLRNECTGGAWLKFVWRGQGRSREWYRGQHLRWPRYGSIGVMRTRAELQSAEAWGVVSVRAEDSQHDLGFGRSIFNMGFRLWVTICSGFFVLFPLVSIGTFGVFDFPASTGYGPAHPLW